MDEHLLGAVRIEGDAFVEEHAVALEVTLNGQQFSGSAVEYTAFAPPRVSAFCPTSGPVAGSTRVEVYGAHFQ